MRLWEIYKDPTRYQAGGVTEMSREDYAGCTLVHSRKPTKAEAQRVADEMRRQGTFCVVRKRKVTK